MITPYELISTLSIRNQKETIQFVNELIETIDMDKQFTNKLGNELEELYLDLCPICGSELIGLDTYENESEYNGFTVSETGVNRITCEDNNCPYTR